MPRIHICLTTLLAVFALGALCTDSMAQNVRRGVPPILRRTPSASTQPIGRQISQYIREVFQDRDGHYWFGTNGDGVARYDGNTLTYFTTQQGFGGSAVRGILQDQRDAIWFATDGGVSRYADGAFTNFTVADGLSDNSLWSIMRDKSGTIWVGTHEGVCRFNGKSFTPFPLPRVAVENPESRFSPKVVFAMIEDSAGNLWFGTDGEGVHKYDGTSFTSYTTREGLTGNMVRALCADRRGQIWIGTEGNGVSCFDGKSFRNFTAKDGLSNDRVYEILEDRAGNIWFSTLGAGACRYDGKTFEPFSVDQGLSVNEFPCPCDSGAKFEDCHGPNGCHVQEFFEDHDGVLWVGCSGGLFCFDGQRFFNVTRDGPWPTPKSVTRANPLQHFEKLIVGEWRMTNKNSYCQFDRWHWGPGQHSAVSRTFGTDGSGNPWSEFQIIYQHPAHKQLQLLSMHPDIPGIGRGVGKGTITFDGQALKARYDLQQPDSPWRKVRKLATNFSFRDATHYREELLEDNGSGFEPLAAWDYVHSKTLSEFPPVAAEAAKPSNRLANFAPLAGHTWTTDSAWSDGTALNVQTSVEWIPYIDAVYTRTALRTETGDAAALLDAFIYHDVAADVLRCLALSRSGGVYEGTVTTLDNSEIQIALTGYEGDQTVQRVVQLDLENNGTLRHRIWSVANGQRTLMLDTRHKRIESMKE